MFFLPCSMVQAVIHMHGQMVGWLLHQDELHLELVPIKMFKCSTK
jgi:hypothetical protein